MRSGELSCRRRKLRGSSEKKFSRNDAHQVVITICGAAVIRLRYGQDVDTNDVDSLTTLNQQIKAAARRVTDSAVGKAEELGEDWLNETVIRIGIPGVLPAGWEDRAVAAGAIFQGKTGRLVVYGLDRLDMIRSKLLCLFDEWGRDIDRDVRQLKKMLKSTDEALAQAKWVLQALTMYEPGKTEEGVRKVIKERLK